MVGTYINVCITLGLIMKHGKVIYISFESDEDAYTNHVEATWWGALKCKYCNTTNKSLKTLLGYISDSLFFYIKISKHVL